MKILFWTIGLIFTLISLPAYLLGMLMGIYKEAYFAGAFRYKILYRAFNKLYDKSYGSRKN